MAQGPPKGSRYDQACTEGPAVAQAALGPDGLRGRHRRRLRGRHAGLHRHDRRVLQEPLRAHAAGRRRRHRGAPGGQVRLLGPADDARRHARRRSRPRRASRSPRAASAPTARCWTRRASRSSPTARRRCCCRSTREDRFNALDYESGGPPTDRRRGDARPRHGQQVRLQGRRHRDRLRHRAREAVQGLRHRLAGGPGQPRRRPAGRLHAARGAADDRPRRLRLDLGRDRRQRRRTRSRRRCRASWGATSWSARARRRPSRRRRTSPTRSGSCAPRCSSSRAWRCSSAAS